ncbi:MULTISPECIES: hypothetical protein [unclassified Pseudoalteromonas]|uniref:hypothetical protein n=1 Tax=unclassified Pseudoalteromonas TaxID=194690 RepID=UPI001603C28B|nr:MULTISPECIES: hypothetical protein [unclassified Pseudoalteromonas]MBB1333896.1 hypothetical protein [Pseudoalteromonas sp. SR41-6]MBB1459617.1 hypothetical protein [Pseudoalteromonas sp. SG41-8]
MNELLLVPVIFVLLLMYNLWRRKDALNAREKMADELESFLATDAPDEHKEAAYAFFTVCLYQYVMPIVTYYMLFGSKQNKENDEPSNFDAQDVMKKEQYKQCKKIMYMGFTVILKRAPITSFFCLLIMLLHSIFKAVINKLSPGESIEQFEDGIEKLAHRNFLFK